MKEALLAALFLTALPASAGQVDPSLLDNPPAADIYIIGEIHDDPLHHKRQARLVEAVQPTAIVFEMLSPGQAEAGAEIDRADEAGLEAAFGWNATGWPDFSMYYPIFAAAPEAVTVGAALPPDRVRASVAEGAAAIFGADAARFGLTAPLPAEEQAQREQLQDDAHCNAMPAEMLPGMVEAQRLRDAAFARSALEAFDTYGGPVIVITGNGHARDWGMPAALEATGTSLRVLSIGQLYSETEEAPFDLWTVSEAITRKSDPCDAFKTK